MTEPHILCTDLVRIFIAQGVEVQALQGLSLRVEPGELTAIVGASGSGKSTLLKILSGLDATTAGRAQVAGHDLLAMSERERVLYRRHTVGFIWQQTSRNLVPYLTAAENIELVLSIGGGPRRARTARATELLELVGAAELAERLPAELSGGQQQRVALAVALANQPLVLLADEPTGELDDASTAEVLEAMRAVNTEVGVTTLIVTHDASVSQHVRRTVRIRDGRTATETLRRTGEAGGEHHAEEFAVLDAVGRLQLPQEYVDALGLRERVRLSLQPEHVEVRSGTDAPTAAPDAGTDAQPTSAGEGDR